MNRILVIGGGQLGWMLALEAKAAGCCVDRFDFINNDIISGDSLGDRAVREPANSSQKLIDHYDVITAEMENLPKSAVLAELVESEKWINRDAFSLLPERDLQKSMLDSLGIANAAWLPIDNVSSIVEAQKKLGERLVIKVKRGGYDGRGQWRLNESYSETSSAALPKEIYGNSIAEKRIPFEREVSLVGARNAKGDCYFFPLATNVHSEGILRYSYYSGSDKVENDLQEQAESALSAIMAELNYIGVMAMECFVESGQLIVNELAPRVHNSGHWTQLGAACNQFALHLKAITGQALPHAQVLKPSLMLNLIGCEYSEEWREMSDVQFYWYKKTVRAGRKLGHLNLSLESFEQFKKTSARLQPYLDNTHHVFLTQAIEALTHSLS